MAVAAGFWLPASGGGASDLTDVDTTTTPPTDGQVLVYDATTSTWLPGDVPAGLSTDTVFAPDYSVTDGTNLDVAVTYVWGINPMGDPYYNSAGVTAGDEAVLVQDNGTGTFSLRPVEV